jgi:hypothetical protein
MAGRACVALALACGFARARIAWRVSNPIFSYDVSVKSLFARASAQVEGEIHYPFK